MRVCVPHECMEPTVTRSSVTYEIGVAGGYKLPSSCWDTHPGTLQKPTNVCNNLAIPHICYFFGLFGISCAMCTLCGTRFPCIYYFEYDTILVYISALHYI